VARPKRFELLTPRFVVWCSIQLSYGRVFRQAFGPKGPDASDKARTVAKERFSYPLRLQLARSGNALRGPIPGSIFVIPGRAIARTSDVHPHIGESRAITSGFRVRCFASPRNDIGDARLRPRPLVADALQFHRPVRYGDPEGGADGAFDQMDIAAMGANQFGGDR
jgi:hypothetical protein